MLNLELSRLDHTVPAVVADASKITDEGMALVISGALTGGDGINVKPCSSTAGERFYGVAMFERRPPSSMPDVVEFTLPSSDAVSDDADLDADNRTVATLPHTPTANTIRVFDDGDALQFVNFADTGGGTDRGLRLDGKEIKIEKTANTAAASTDRWLHDDRTGTDAATGFGGTTAVTDANVSEVALGSKIRIQYSYAPTVTQQVALVGTSIDLTPLGAGAAVTCIRKGIVFTTFYDTAQDYKIGDPVGLGAGGRFTVTAPLQASGAAATASTTLGGLSGTDLQSDRAVVVHVPSASNPLLGIELL